MDENAIEFTSRYDITGPPNGCSGDCEGTGIVPIYMSEGDPRSDPGLARLADETHPGYVAAWRKAEAKDPTDDGWHFVDCPTCSAPVSAGLDDEPR